LQTNELLSSLACILHGFGLMLLMIHAHVPLYSIIAGYLYMIRSYCLIRTWSDHPRQ
jgi:hypothetical protein